MSQRSRPVADLDLGGWTTGPAFSKLNEPVPDDGSFVTSPSNGGSLLLALGKLSPPDPGAQVVTVRLAAAVSGVPVAVELLQFGVVIASWTVTPVSGFQDYSHTLTDPEKALITDYRSLRVRITDPACELVTDCAAAPGGVPRRWQFYAADTGGEVVLAYAGSCTWTGFWDGIVVSANVRLQHTGTDWVLYVPADESGAVYTVDDFDPATGGSFVLSNPEDPGIEENYPSEILLWPACEPGGSGSGSGSIAEPLVGCGDGDYPASGICSAYPLCVRATYSAPGCPELDGRVVTAVGTEYLPNVWLWQFGVATNSNFQVGPAFFVALNGTCYADKEGSITTWDGEDYVGASYNGISAGTCHPFSVTFSYTLDASAVESPGAVVTITLTAVECP